MLSIVMIAWNEGPWLESSIRSICEATDGDFEFILIDDASDSGQFSWVIDEWDFLEWTSVGSKGVFHRNATRLGVSRSRNIGLDLAKGDVIQYHDAHDWIKVGNPQALATAARETGGIICPTWGNFTGQRKNLDARGWTWEDSLANAMDGKTPLNHGSGLVFAPHKFWFYLCIDRKIKPRLSRRSAAHAVGMTVRKDVLESLGGWLEMPGPWGGNDACLSIKAQLAGVPIQLEPAVELLHMVKDPCTHGTNRHEELLNAYYTASVLFTPKLYREFWEPGLLSRRGALPAAAKRTLDPEQNPALWVEQGHWREIIPHLDVREAAFMAAMVQPRIAAKKQGEGA